VKAARIRSLVALGGEVSVVDMDRMDTMAEAFKSSTVVFGKLLARGRG
jgi:hypothetical protein